MSLTVNIENLLKNQIVESTRIEYKSSFNPNAVMHTICAFANDIDNIGGGYILIGVEEKDGVPVYPLKGIETQKVDSILKDLLGYCHLIEPYYAPVVEPVMYQGVCIIVIWVQGGYGRPYKVSKDVLSKDKSNKQYYIRKFSSTVIATNAEEKELFYISSNIPYDDRPNLLAKVTDLNIQLMQSHLLEIESSLYEQSQNMSLTELAKKMQLISGPPENLKPLNVGVLMFSNNLQKYFKNARIEIVDIPEPTGENMLEKVFTGAIQNQLKDALQFIKNYVIKEAVIKRKGETEADRFYNYPYEAIKEILANAVYHRSYQVEEPITVRITSNEIEITSFPGFDRSITDEDIKRYNISSRIYRNRRIGDFLKEIKLIEGRNTGYPNAIKALKNNGSPELRFSMDTERNYLSVIIPVHSYFSNSNKTDEKQTEYEMKIANILMQQSMTLTELSKSLGYKSISKKLRTTVTNMIDEGVILQKIENFHVRLYVRNNKR